MSSINSYSNQIGSLSNSYKSLESEIRHFSRENDLYTLKLILFENKNIDIINIIDSRLFSSYKIIIIFYDKI